MIRKSEELKTFTSFFSSQNEFLEQKGVFHDEMKHDQNS